MAATIHKKKDNYVHRLSSAIIACTQSAVVYIISQYMSEEFFMKCFRLYCSQYTNIKGIYFLNSNSTQDLVFGGITLKSNRTLTIMSMLALYLNYFSKSGSS